MRIPKLVPALTLLSLSIIPSFAHAEVFTTLQFFGPLSADQTFSTNDIRITSDSRSRNDAIASASANASADIGTGKLAAKATGQKFVVGESDIAARAIGSATDTLTITGPAGAAIPVAGTTDHFAGNLDAVRMWSGMSGAHGSPAARRRCHWPVALSSQVTAARFDAAGGAVVSADRVL